MRVAGGQAGDAVAVLIAGRLVPGAVYLEAVGDGIQLFGVGGGAHGRVGVSFRSALLFSKPKK